MLTENSERVYEDSVVRSEANQPFGRPVSFVRAPHRPIKTRVSRLHSQRKVEQGF